MKLPETQSIFGIIQSVELRDLNFSELMLSVILFQLVGALPQENPSEIVPALEVQTPTSSIWPQMTPAALRRVYNITPAPVPEGEIDSDGNFADFVAPGFQSDASGNGGQAVSPDNSWSNPNDTPNPINQDPEPIPYPSIGF